MVFPAQLVQVNDGEQRQIFGFYRFVHSVSFWFLSCSIIGVAFPDGLKFRFLYDAGVEFLAPDMGVQFPWAFNSSTVGIGVISMAPS